MAQMMMVVLVVCDLFKDFCPGNSLKLFTSLDDIAARGDIKWPTPAADDDGVGVDDDDVSGDCFMSFRTGNFFAAAPELFISLDNLLVLAE